MRRLPSAVVAVLVALALSASAQGQALSAEARGVLAQMNRTRAAHGLSPLRVDEQLCRAATAHSRDMLLRDYFAHGAFASRMLRFDAQGPVFGENLAWAVGTTRRPGAIVGMWLRSAPHRRNLLRPGFARVGVAAPSGEFAGRNDATVVTVDFAGH